MRIFYQSPVAHEWIRQRPHFVAEGLAKSGHRVFWFYAANLLKTRFRRWDDGNGFLGLELPVLPLATRFPPFGWLNRLWVSWWLRKVEADVAIMTNPVACHWLPRHLMRVPVVYDCMDVQTAFFSGLRRQRMLEAEGWLVRSATRIIASSDVIRDKLVSEYGGEAEEILVIPNGVSVEPATVATSRNAVRRPSLAYFGTIGKWFDWESVLDAARRHADWHFDFFGPADGAIPSLPPNVVLHGPVSHGCVAGYAADSDVLLMPFVRNGLIDGVDPVKMYEYLQTGRPIVSSWWPLLEKFAAFPAVRFYGRGQSLSQAVSAALEGPPQFTPPQAFLRSCGWNGRIRAIEAVTREAHKWAGDGRDD